MCQSSLRVNIHKGKDHALVVRLLLQAGASVNARTSTGIAPLHLACTWPTTTVRINNGVSQQTKYFPPAPRTAVVRELLQSPDIEIMLLDEKGDSPLSIARKCGCAEIVALLEQRISARDLL